MAPSTSTRVINEGTIAVVTTKKTVAKKSKKRMQKGKKNQAVHNAVVAFEGGGGRICSSITPLMHHVPTKRDMSIFVVKMDVPTTSKREEFVSLNGAKMKRCSFEGCANNIVVKGGVCVTHGAKRKNAAAMRGVPIKLLMEEFVSRSWRQS